MKYPFRQVDVFSSKACFGNPVAVFLESEGLSTEEMQRIARWTNLSETTFVSKSKVADYKVRIFTPLEELPFAGHPTLGTAWALKEAGVITKDKCIQECDFGLVNIEFNDGKVYFELPKYEIEPLKREDLLNTSTGVTLNEGRLITTGPRWITARAEHSDALANASIHKEQFMELLKANDCTGATLYAFRPAGGVDVRSFFETFDSIAEDPVCGSGNAAVAAHIIATQKTALTGKSYTAYQGSALQRDGRIFVALGDKIKIGGACNTVFQGMATI